MGVKHPIAGIDDLEFLNPRIADEWDAAKNQDLDISQYVAGSAKIVWWKCASCGYEWRAAIRSRYQRGSGCPLCAHSKRGKSRVEMEIKRRGYFDNSELLKDWDYAKTLFCRQVLRPSVMRRCFGNAMCAGLNGKPKSATVSMVAAVRHVQGKFFMLVIMILRQ